MKIPKFLEIIQLKDSDKAKSTKKMVNITIFVEYTVMW